MRATHHIALAGAFHVRDRRGYYVFDAVRPGSRRRPYRGGSNDVVYREREIIQCFCVTESVCASCHCCWPASRAVANPYYVTDLGTVGSGTISVAYGIATVNGAAEAVGFSRAASNVRVPVAWIGGTATNLLPLIPGATATVANVANAIDSNGDVVGNTTVGGNTSAFYLPSGGTGTVLPYLNATSPMADAAGVSNSGAVAGYSTASDGNAHAFVWSASGGMIDLGTSGVCSYATGISADGNTVIGDTGATSVGQLGQACEWTRSGSTWTMTPLVQLSQYNQSVANAINSSGNVVGGAFDYPEGGFPNVYQIARRIPAQWFDRPHRRAGQ